MAFDKTEVLSLSADEKRALAFELLDSIDEEAINHPIPEWKETLIRQRIEKDKQAPNEVIAWNELRKKYER